MPDCASSFDGLSTPLRHSDFLVDSDSLVILCQVTWHAITEDIQFVVDGMEVSPCELGSIYPAMPALQLDVVSTNPRRYQFRWSLDLQEKVPYLTEKPSLGPRALLPPTPPWTNFSTASLVFNINDRQVESELAVSNHPPVNLQLDPQPGMSRCALRVIDFDSILCAGVSTTRQGLGHDEEW